MKKKFREIIGCIISSTGAFFLTGNGNRFLLAEFYLTTFIELGMFDLRHVKFSVDTIQQVFLDNLMHNNGNQQIEKDCWQIL